MYARTAKIKSIKNTVTRKTLLLVWSTVCAIQCVFVSSASSHMSSDGYTSHEIAVEESGVLSSAYHSDVSKDHSHATSDYVREAAILNRLLDANKTLLTERLQLYKSIYRRSDIEVLENIDVSGRRDVSWWCGVIRSFVVSKETHCALTNALAYIYAQAHTSAEKLIVLREKAAVAIRAYDIDRALEYLSFVPDDIDMKDTRAHEEYIQNMYDRALVNFQTLRLYAEAKEIFEQLIHIDNDKAQVFGHSGLARYYAVKGDWEMAYKMVEQGRKRIDSTSDPLNILGHTLRYLRDKKDDDQESLSSTKPLTAEDTREILLIRRDLFWDIPGAHERLKFFYEQLHQQMN